MYISCPNRAPAVAASRFAILLVLALWPVGCASHLDTSTRRPAERVGADAGRPPTTGQAAAPGQNADPGPAAAPGQNAASGPTAASGPAVAPGQHAASARNAAQPLFIAPHQPLALQLTADRRALVVLERGSLTVRDPRTLAVQRYLLPRVDGWRTLGLAADGSLEAATVESSHFRFNPRDWSVERLPTQPMPLVGDVLWQSHQGGSYPVRPKGDDKKVLVAEAGLGASWKYIRQDHRLPELPEGAVADMIVSSPDLEAFMAADTTGRLYRLEADAATPGAVSTVDAGGPLSFLKTTGSEVIAVARGQVLVFDTHLKLLERAPLPTATRRVGSMPLPLPENLPRESRAFGTIYRIPPGTTPDPGPRALRDALYLPESHALVWVADDFELAVSSLKGGRMLARVPAIGERMNSAFLVGREGAVFLAQGTLQCWNTSSGLVQWELPGPWLDAVKLDDERILVSSPGGKGQVIDARSGKTKRRLCLSMSPCKDGPPRATPGAAGTEADPRADTEAEPEADPERLEQDLRNLGEHYNTRQAAEAAAEKQAGKLFQSPDGRLVAWVGRGDSSTGEGSNQLSVWDVQTLKRLGGLSKGDYSSHCGRTSELRPEFLDASTVRFCDDNLRLPPNGQPKAPPRAPQNTPVQAEDAPVPPSEEDAETELEQFSGPAAPPAWSITPTGAHYKLGRGRHPLRTDLPGMVPTPALKSAAALIDVLELSNPELRDTFVDLDTSGNRLLVANGVEVPVGHADLGSASSLNLVNWLLEARPPQVWRVPDAATEAGKAALETLKEPPEPTLPADRLADGIQEHAVPGFPMKIRLAALGPDAIYLLGMSTLEQGPYEESDGLWRLDPGRGLEAIPLPTQRDIWLRVSVAPVDGTVWLLGRRSVNRLEPNGKWLTWPLAYGRLEAEHDQRSIGDQAASRRLLALDGNRAAVVHPATQAPASDEELERAARERYDRVYVRRTTPSAHPELHPVPAFEKVRESLKKELKRPALRQQLELFGPEGIITAPDIKNYGGPIVLNRMPGGCVARAHDLAMRFQAGKWSEDLWLLEFVNKHWVSALEPVGDHYLMQVDRSADGKALEQAEIWEVAQGAEKPGRVLFTAPLDPSPSAIRKEPGHTQLRLVGAGSSRFQVLVTNGFEPDRLIELDASGQELARSLLRTPRWLAGVGQGEGPGGSKLYLAAPERGEVWLIEEEVSVMRYHQGEWTAWFNPVMRSVGMRSGRRR